MECSDAEVSPCCDASVDVRIAHVLDYDRGDATSVVTTYRVTSCSACSKEVGRVVVAERRGMEERLPIGETIILPSFLQELRWRLARGEVDDG